MKFFLVGAGISNIALARKMAEAGNSVVVIDQRSGARWELLRLLGSKWNRYP